MNEFIKQSSIFLLLITGLAISSCNSEIKTMKKKRPEEKEIVQKKLPTNDAFKANQVAEIGRNVRSIFQDKNDDYWFGTEAGGVYRYDGKTLVLFTEKDGLCNNQVRTIQQDKFGNIWFNTGNGISRFDGKKFTTFPNEENPISTDVLGQKSPINQSDLWFEAGDGAYRYDNYSWNYFALSKPNLDTKATVAPSNQLTPFTVYSTLKDKKGNLWFGTQSKGVCCYDGKTFKWFTEKGLAGPAVLALFEDEQGNMWFGNNGSGVFRYDGKSLVNFTE